MAGRAPLRLMLLSWGGRFSISSWFSADLPEMQPLVRANHALRDAHGDGRAVQVQEMGAWPCSKQTLGSGQEHGGILPAWLAGASMLHLTMSECAVKPRFEFEGPGQHIQGLKSLKTVPEALILPHSSWHSLNWCGS